MSTKDKLIKTGIVLFLILLAAFFTYFAYLQILVARGDLIKDHGQWYKRADWEKLFGEYDTPAKNTPEEVYKNFRQALLDDDIETALGFIRVESRGKYINIFGEESKMIEYKKLPEVSFIVKNEHESIGNQAVYSYYLSEEQEMPYFLMFRKNKEGHWEIDSI